ncbi:hypothetical protein BU25DRAFT_425838 [Macroventuria anomochaeta]|uniref:Uncharacterized protein n=1 Tax=Macroventuria anomochaeta TaxID=301207 RepID=A0ACB6RJQ5_9PLEO|nr:uncharacterized protein BU25DRAFT_425838 [Macroventuria anomochaeta]KAF2622236.1 hypothetical protein BU25DRAFT_425838 [Macroventuria anomochaeta]
MEKKVSAILMGWYAGVEGGHGLADVLCGRVDASGRLSYSTPTSEGHLQPYDTGATTFDLNAGDTKKASISASQRPLQRWKHGQYVLPSKDVVIEVGSFSDDPGNLATQYYLTGSKL